MGASTGLLRDWAEKGFALRPRFEVAGDAGLVMYRCWGGESTELGSGFFAEVKPRSVIEAELLFNVVDWNNQLLYVSTFRLKPGFEYFVGPVAHGPRDLHLTANQIYVPPKLDIKVEWKGRDPLSQDATVLLLNSRSVKPGAERGQA